jgi:uncharacterized protein YfcZ (UPF0381/DUF406 family)
MPSINQPSISNLHDADVVINGSDYEMVYSYLRSIFNTDDAAGDFATTLMQVARDIGQSPGSVIAELKTLDQLTLTTTLAFYLNRLRDPSTLLGVRSITTPNYYVARNILP